VSDVAEPFGDTSSLSADFGGDSSSSDGSSPPAGTDESIDFAALPPDTLECPGCDFVAKNRLGLANHIRQKHSAPLSEAAGVTPATSPPEKRPRGKGRRRRLTRARTKTETPGSAPTRPSVKRVSTAPITSSLVTFAAGGLARVGQTPLAQVASFTSPIAGGIVDEAIAGTLVDRLAQPLVRGGEKYQNLGALLTAYGSVWWASNNPDQAEAAYSAFEWSMTLLLPIFGKEMAAQAKAQKKALDTMAEVMPELVEIFGDNPIRGLWQRMWSNGGRHAAPVEEPAQV
jgi:hypothetical protein